MAAFSRSCNMTSFCRKCAGIARRSWLRSPQVYFILGYLFYGCIYQTQMLRQRGNIQSWNSWMESAVFVRGKLGDLLTCGKNVWVKKRQLLPISRFAAKMQYILPLRSYNIRLKLQGDVSDWKFDVCFLRIWGPWPSAKKKGAARGSRARSPCSFDIFFKLFCTKATARHWLAIFEHSYRPHMVMLWKR